ncbi:hypothetical protein VTJ04DRAFT_3139 [Mycothermus thermophilus]|uniref:uncharacterized protein n=1 Tax=Humicola insolens TaxID=85995 RepID=UPI0037447ADE
MGFNWATQQPFSFPFFLPLLQHKTLQAGAATAARAAAGRGAFAFLHCIFLFDSMRFVYFCSYSYCPAVEDGGSKDLAVLVAVVSVHSFFSLHLGFFSPQERCLSTLTLVSRTEGK